MGVGKTRRYKSLTPSHLCQAVRGEYRWGWGVETGGGLPGDYGVEVALDPTRSPILELGAVRCSGCGLVAPYDAPHGAALRTGTAPPYVFLRGKVYCARKGPDDGDRSCYEKAGFDLPSEEWKKQWKKGKGKKQMGEAGEEWKKQWGKLDERRFRDDRTGRETSMFPLWNEEEDEDSE